MQVLIKLFHPTGDVNQCMLWPVNCMLCQSAACCAVSAACYALSAACIGPCLPTRACLLLLCLLVECCVHVACVCIGNSATLKQALHHLCHIRRYTHSPSLVSNSSQAQLPPCTLGTMHSSCPKPFRVVRCTACSSWHSQLFSTSPHRCIVWKTSSIFT